MTKKTSNGQSSNGTLELAESTQPWTEAAMKSANENGATVPAIVPDPLEEKPKDTLSDIHFNLEEAKSYDGLNKILASHPPENWIKEHPITKGKYIQISTVEMLLRKVFQRTRTEVIDIRVIANAVAVHIRLHYKDPVSGEWDYQDGLGAVAIQVEKGSPAMDFNKTKSDAIQKNLPAAESYAIKDAAEKLGSLFGANLNRKDEIEFKPSYTTKKETKWTQAQQQ